MYKMCIETATVYIAQVISWTLALLTLPQDIFDRGKYSGTSHEQTRSGREKGVCNWSWPLTGM